MAVLAIDPGLTVGWAFIYPGEFEAHIIDGQESHETFLKLIQMEGTFLYQLCLRYSFGVIDCVVEETPTLGLGTLGSTLSTIQTTIERLFPHHTVILPGTWKNSKWKDYQFMAEYDRHALDAIKMGLYWLHREEK